MTFIWFVLKSEFCGMADHGLIRWNTLRLDVNGLDSEPVMMWDHARYLIEHRMFLHKTPQKKSHAYSCISAMDLDVYILNACVWDSNLEMQRVDVVSHEMRLIIKRGPIRWPLQRYVPLRFKPVSVKSAVDIVSDKSGASDESTQVDAKSEGTEDEDEKIRGIMQAAATFPMSATDVFYRDEMHKHPSEYKVREDRVVPQAGYTCRGCGKMDDHFRGMCPNPVIDQLDRIRAPHGIPKLFLEIVEPGVSSGLRLSTGEFVKRSGGVFLTSEAASTERVIETVTAPCVTMPVVNTPEHPANDVDVDVRGFYFDFEDYLNVSDASSKAFEGAFYKKHPELAQKHGSLCSYYVRGLCQKTQLECKFLHVCDARLMPVCQFFLANACVNDPCVFRHDFTPLRRKMQCAQYKNGFCKRGPWCELTHIRETPQACRTFLGQARFTIMIDALSNIKRRRIGPRELRRDGDRNEWSDEL